MAKEAVFCAKLLHFVWELGKMATVILVWMWARRPGKEWNMSEFRGSQNYVASEELMRAVNIAMVLQALGKKLIIWNIKSTTKAQDGLYVYDVVQRLYDSQFGGEGVDDIAKYVRLGKLGEAFTAEEQVILLIDEIDKADLEFPNDLLWELDRMEFHIPETGETLRRCVFHYIEFPDKELMAEIVRVHFPDLEENLLTQALEAFYRIRQMPQIKKKPSTSEIIDWLRALVHEGVDPKRVVKEVPYLGVLLKKNEDMDALRRAWR